MQIPNLQKDFLNIKEFLTFFSTALQNLENDISINNKNIEVANIEQPSLLGKYDEFKIVLHHAMEYATLKIEERKSLAFKEITENAANDYSDRAKLILIESDPQYLKLNLHFLDIKHLYLRYDSAVTQFQQRSYSLNNIVRIREHELENITLYAEDDYMKRS